MATSEDSSVEVNDTSGASLESESMPPCSSASAAYALRDPYLLRHRAVYFLGALIMAAYYPFVVQLWTAHDGAALDISQAGAVLAGAAITSALAAPILTMLADRGERWRRALLVGGFALQGAAIFFAGFARGWPALLLLHSLAQIGGAGAWPVADAATSRLAALVPQLPRYGGVRVFASVGWGGGGVASGALYDFVDRRAAFVVAAGAAAVTAVLAAGLPLESKKASSHARTVALRALLTPSAAAFVVAITVGAALNSAVDNFRGVFLEMLGASDAQVGASLAVSAAAEVPAFLLAPALLARFGAPRTLVVALLAFAMRFLGLGAIASAYHSTKEGGLGLLAAAAACDVLHGAAFAFSWTAAVDYFSKLFPVELAASAQAILAAIQWGIGSALGAAVMGSAIHVWGWRDAWRAGAACAALAAVLAAIAGRGDNANPDDGETERETTDYAHSSSTTSTATATTLHSDDIPTRALRGAGTLPVADGWDTLVRT